MAVELMIHAAHAAQAFVRIRKNDLRLMKCGTNDVWWGSTFLDEAMRTNGYPVAHAFDWAQNPWNEIYGKNSRGIGGTGWGQCFQSMNKDSYLQEQQFDPHRYYDTQQGGITLRYGFNEVLLNEPSESGSYSGTYGSSFADEVYDTVYVHDRSCDLFVEDLLTNAFQYVNTSNVWEDTGRIRFREMATLNQALSIMNKTYHAPGDFLVCTNLEKTLAEIFYTVEGDLGGCTVTVDDYGNVTLSGNGSAYINFDSVVMSVKKSKERIHVEAKWPCASAGEVSVGMGGAGSVHDANSGSKLDIEELKDAINELDPNGQALPNGTFWFVPIGEHNYFVSNATRVSSVHSYNQSPIPHPGVYTPSVRAHVLFSYTFQEVTPSVFGSESYVGGGQGSGGDGWRYPTNTAYYKAGTAVVYTFCSSFATLLADKDLRYTHEVDFNWGLNDDWLVCEDYGYKANVLYGPPQNVDQYMDALYIMIQDLSIKCHVEAGVALDHPEERVEDSEQDAIQHLSSINTWEVYVGTGPAAPQSFVVEHTKDGPRMTPSTVTLATAVIQLSPVDPGHTYDNLPEPTTVFTKTKGIIEAYWDPPQVRTLIE